MPATLEVTGTLTADARTDVAAEADGRIVQVAIERGMVVAAGSVVARLDEQDAANQLREAEATEAQTRARLGLGETGSFDPSQTAEARRSLAFMERAEAEYQRYARLVEMGAVSRSEYDAKRADAIAFREQYEEILNQMRQLYQSLQAQKARVAWPEGPGRHDDPGAVRRVGRREVRQRGRLREEGYAGGDDHARGPAAGGAVDPRGRRRRRPEGPDGPVHRAGLRRPDLRGHHRLRRPRAASRRAGIGRGGGGPEPEAALQPGLFASARIELLASTPTPVVPAAAVRTEAGVARLYVVTGGRAELRSSSSAARATASPRCSAASRRASGSRSARWTGSPTGRRERRPEA